MRAIDRVTIRRAGPGDAVRLLDLAALDGADQVTGEVLVAEVDGELWAAIELASERAIADPFRPSAAMVELLRLRTARIRPTEQAQARGARRRAAGYADARLAPD